jgi:hypothetical protein
MSAIVPAPLALTDRDIELLLFISSYKLIPLEILAARFFSISFATGARTKDPKRACEKRVLELAQAGYLHTKIVKGRSGTATREVRLTASSAQAVDVPRPRPLPVRGRVHHMQTLRAIEELRTELERDGARTRDVALEFQQRRRIQAGRATKKGEEYDNFADAIITVERTSPEGHVKLEELALEYVTSKYTDRDIIDKAESFRRFDRTVFVADSPRTAARVRRLTGEPCRVLEGELP